MGSTEIVFLSLNLLLTVVYFWVEHYFSYWRRKNVITIKPNFLLGNLKELCFMKTSPAEHLANLYNHKNAENQPFVGIHVFHQPALLIRSPELIKQLFIKDFNKFSNRFSFADPHRDVLGSNNLFFVKNPHWKQIRNKLTPVFSSGKLKQMLYLVDQVGSKLNSHLCSLTAKSDATAYSMELKELCALYTTDVIANIAFGIEANSFKNPNGEFRKNGREIFNFTIKRAFEFTTVFFLPKLVSLFKVKLFSPESSKFLRETINYAIGEREKTGIIRNDLIDVLVSLKKSSEDEKDPDVKGIKYNNDFLVAQAAVFFTAGFETTSTTICFALYELAKNMDSQKRLRTEIWNCLADNNGEITYDSVLNMEYLNMVVQEVLRMYPPLPILDRECTLAKDEKNYSLHSFGDFEIPTGMPVYVPIYGIQRDPKYFPNPDTFDPERFALANKNKIIPCSYIPFGIGPHNCIGERFGILQTKIGLIHFLKNHYVRPCDKSHKIMKLDPRALIIQSTGGVYCDIIRDTYS